MVNYLPSDLLRALLIPPRAWGCEKYPDTSPFLFILFSVGLLGLESCREPVSCVEFVSLERKAILVKERSGTVDFMSVIS